MALLTFLKARPEARRIFGQRELQIIEKQLLGINLTQSEKNRLSRDIRPKFEFIRKAARFEEEFELKKGAIVKSLIVDTLEVIKRDQLASKITEIILFGSSVMHQRTLHSDVDIAVKFLDIDNADATRFRARISGRTDAKVDIQVYNALPDKIKKEVDKGKIIWTSG